VLAIAALCLPGCDFSFSRDDGDTKVSGRATADGGAAALRMVAAQSAEATPHRCDEPLLLRFTGPLEESSVHESVRVEDMNRGGIVVPVRIRAEGDALVLDPAASPTFREGALLRVTVAGMPSLRSLRSTAGQALGTTETARFQVIAARRRDREPPGLLFSDPLDGAEGVDPDAPIALVFSEPMSVESFADGTRSGLRLTADGQPVTFQVHLDRHRTTATLTPDSLPGGTRVKVDLGTRVRDAAGNRISLRTPRRIEFTTAFREEGLAALRWWVEPFDDASGVDPTGTTVAWGEGPAAGVLQGVVTDTSLNLHGEGARRVFSLDPAGGSLLLIVPASVMGDEARLLKGLSFAAPPGPAQGEVLGVRVRIAPLLLDGANAFDIGGLPAAPWMTVVEDAGSAAGSRGFDSSLQIPFHHPYIFEGDGSLLIEVEWSGVTGPVLLSGAETQGFRPVLSVRGRESTTLPFLPDVGIETVGLRPVARSRWRDAGTDGVQWLEPRMTPAAHDRIRLEFQAAPEAAEGGIPDLSRVTPWSQSVRALANHRFVRFRVVFTTVDGAAPAVLDDLALPYR
jgi:hypothetical protein